MRKYKDVLLCLGISLFFSCIQIVYYLPVLINSSDASLQASFYYNYLFPSFLPEVRFLFQILLSLLPIFVLLYFFIPVMLDDFCCSGVYIFTRQNSRIKWIMKIVVKMALLSFLYSIMHIVVIYLGLLLWAQSSVAISDGLRSIAIYVVFNSIFIFLVLTVSNTLAIRFGSHISFAISLVALMGFIVAAFSTYPFINSSLICLWVFKLNPLSNAVIPWHLPARGYISVITISGFDLKFSTVYYIILMTIMFISILIYIKRTDIGLEDRDGQ